MSTRTTNSTKLPDALYQARKRFDQWRQTHKPRSRFSEALWSEAVAVAHQNGLTRTARVLGLDYYSLKKRLAHTPGLKGGNKIAPPCFVELFPPPADSTECIVDMDDGDGGKMHISLKGREIPDLVCLIRSFWGAQT